jgi:hypothetical protein
MLCGCGPTACRCARSPRAWASGRLRDYLQRAARAGLVWPLPEALTDAALEAMLFQRAGGPTRWVLAQPDWPTIHRKLRRKDVTLALVWEEYRVAHPDGYSYSRFGAKILHLPARRLPRRVSRQALLAGLKELLRPAVVEALRDALAPAELRDAVLVGAHQQRDWPAAPAAKRHQPASPSGASEKANLDPDRTACASSSWI